jgi:ferrochelatase
MMDLNRAQTDATPKRGVLLINLGSPDSTRVKDVRKYLAEFLMDKRVIDVPALARFMIVYGCILPFRPRQSAEAYGKIWTNEGSPLVVMGRKVQTELEGRIGLPVELAMRYQNPSAEAALGRLMERGVKEVLVIPLFPHFAMSSYGTAVEKVKAVRDRTAPELTLRVMPPYYADPDYIEALAGSAAGHLEEGIEHLLFSFHGLPERHLRKTDPTGCHCLVEKNCCEDESPAHATCYRAQCYKTVSAFAERTGLDPGQYSVAFQSRLGRDPWLKPYTDEVIANLAKSGVRKLTVMCPAFVADCLETLEEIGMRGREIFLGNGGEAFQLIPCLNAHPLWLQALANMAERKGFARAVAEPK